MTNFFSRFFACLLALCALPVAAQPTGQWDIVVEGGDPLPIAFLPAGQARGLSSTALSATGDVNSTNFATTNAIDMRGEVTDRVWSGEWLWYGDRALSPGLTGCGPSDNYSPTHAPAERTTNFHGEFQVTFNSDQTRFAGTMRFVCTRRDGRTARGRPVLVSATRRAVQPAYRVVRPERSDNAYDRIKYGIYETTWGRADVQPGNASGTEVRITFQSHPLRGFNYRHSMSAGDWRGHDAGTGDRPPLVGRYFLDIDDRVPFTPATNPPPSCPESFNIDLRRPWDFGRLQAPRWGSFQVNFSPFGDSFTGRFLPCWDRHPSEYPAAWPSNTEFSGRYVGVIGNYERVDRRVEPLPNVPLLGRDGPCRSMSSTAVVSFTPCRSRILVPLRMRFNRAIANGDFRVVFKPLVADQEAIFEAVRQNQPLPRDPAMRDVEQIIRGRTENRAGDEISVMAPGATCQRDFWEVYLLDSAGQLYHNNGIITMECGPGTIPEGW